MTHHHCWDMLHCMKYRLRIAHIGCACSYKSVEKPRCMHLRHGVYRLDTCMWYALPRRRTHFSKWDLKEALNLHTDVYTDDSVLCSQPFVSNGKLHSRCTPPGICQTHVHSYRNLQCSITKIYGRACGLMFSFLAIPIGKTHQVSPGHIVVMCCHEWPSGQSILKSQGVATSGMPSRFCGGED